MSKGLLKVLLVFFSLLGSELLAQADHAAVERPIWSKHASILDLSCAQETHSIVAPDHKSSARVLCGHKHGNFPYSLRIIEGKKAHVITLQEGAHELLWAPNSEAFFVSGGTTSYAGFFVDVYTLNANSTPHRQNLTGVAQRDMVAQFPPCKAANGDEATCKRIEENPQFNMSGIAWSADSSAIHVFAEVPCSSSYGGIMCQVVGYVLNVADGRILKRLSAQETQASWKSDMAWDVRIPENPTYGLSH
ncbi:hypothetical protein Terro_3754 [Terriglobus roseus DSM 18391]|uniref:Uncharacterized protein n=1 Tax=Terriglobus roseus (strain DSM 18391 / NRRL B-41598 / KBS 63) TaxID=926566 RepID=I3ZL47_TERRK|nr:hypothetical protein [Terriglobus roseus]AFL89965.1 hypothetical protein Terro_3754 [Terriglobus roseus DSM 18391]